MAERAGLENRRWGNPSASSNLAPSAKFSRAICAFSAGTVAELWLTSVGDLRACNIPLSESSRTASTLSSSLKSASQTIA